MIIINQASAKVRQTRATYHPMCVAYAMLKSIVSSGIFHANLLISKMISKIYDQDILTIAIPVFVVILFVYRRCYGSSPPLPPGPPKLPLLGNLFNLPSDFEWETFQALGKEYSLSSYFFLFSVIFTLFSWSRHRHSSLDRPRAINCCAQLCRCRSWPPRQAITYLLWPVCPYLS